MNSADTKLRLGTAELTPSGPVVAGSVGEWTIRLTVGSYGIDEGGTIKVAQRFASDWEAPQFERPTESGFTTIETNGKAKLAARYDRKGHIRPWMRCLVIDVYDGSLAPGDVVIIRLGDRRQGSPGIRAQTFQESAHEFRVFVDPTNACLVRPIAESPTFPVVAGDTQSLVCFLPTDGVVGETVDVFVRGRDAWDNPTPAPEGTSLSWKGPTECAVVKDGKLTLSGPGVGRVSANLGGMTEVSNPICIHAKEPTRQRFWGDLHAQTDATVGTGTEEEYFTYGRDQARLDFTSHQGNDFQVTDENWRRLNDVVREFHEDGRFVVFPGYEWSANSPAGGDRNVFYLEEDLPIIRSSHWQVEEAENVSTPAHPADEFFRQVREQVDFDKVLVASHVGGRYADIRKYLDSELAPLVEVTSCWGIFEWMLWDAFENGHQVGVMCNSDGHKGRPGDEGPGAGQFGIGSGLTCVLAESLTRNAVFSALKQRRCYGTTGPRIALEFTADGQPMGSAFTTAHPVSIDAHVEGVSPVECLELYEGPNLIERIQAPEFEDCSQSRRVRVMWGGSRIRGRGRRAVWDGTIKVVGNSILQAQTVAFDSPADGIQEQSEDLIRFRSRTTGDSDGIDLVLKDPSAGSLELQTPLGNLSVSLADLTELRTDFGGLDLYASIRWYPETVRTHSLSLSAEWNPIAGKTTPLFIKTTQVDGHMAWASPVYVTK